MFLGATMVAKRGAVALGVFWTQGNSCQWIPSSLTKTPEPAPPPVAVSKGMGGGLQSAPTFFVFSTVAEGLTPTMGG